MGKMVNGREMQGEMKKACGMRGEVRCEKDNGKERLY
jgi:hypothetical protein